MTIDGTGEFATTNGTMKVAVVVALAEPSSEMNVRLRVFSTGGNVVYQKTERRSKLNAAIYPVTFTRQMSTLGLREGRHRMEVQVAANGQSPVTLDDTLYVYSPHRRKVPLAVVVRFSGAPVQDTSGRTVPDPGEGRAQDSARAMEQLVTVRPDLKLTLAPLPALLEDWHKAAEPLATPAASPSEAVDASRSAACDAALRSLARVADASSVLDVPYSDPDVSGLLEMGAIDDLGLHLDRGALVMSETISAVAGTGTIVSGADLPMTAVHLLASRGIGYALAGRGVLKANTAREATVAPAAYRVKETSLTVLALDSHAAWLLSSPSSTRAQLMDHLFTRLISDRLQGQPIVAVIDVGPRSAGSISALQAKLAALDRIGWIRLVSTSEAAVIKPAASLKVRTGRHPSVPKTYWDRIGSARKRVMALASASSSREPETFTALRDLMLAESAEWSGGDPRQAAAGQSLLCAMNAETVAWGVLSKIALTCPSITLSASTGKVPVSVVNRSGKSLHMTLRVKSTSMRLPKGASFETVARPGENILTVPVDLGATLSGAVDFELWAGDLRVTRSTAVVRASYIDRLALIGGVVLVLLVLLWYIHRRGGSAFDRLRLAAGKRISKTDD